MERKSVPFELKDMSRESRSAIIAHAVYNSIDRVGDISTKGMFSKSWKENKAIDFLFNHDESQIPGVVLRTFEDDEKAYTEVKFGNWKLGDDVMEMAEAGVLRGASFGYETKKKEFKSIGGRKVRRLQEVKHLETSLLTKMPAHPEAGIVSLTKALEVKTLSSSEQDALKKILNSDQSVLEQLAALSATLDVTSDLYTWINYSIERRASMLGDLRSQLKYNSGELRQLKSYLQRVEAFCKDSTASDECIKTMESEIQETKAILSQYDTADTPPITEPCASVRGFSNTLHLLTLKTFA